MVRRASSRSDVTPLTPVPDPDAEGGESGDGRRERWRAHRVSRRAELIDTVIDVVDRHGADVGMDDIAAAAGIAKPVFYRYFHDKADLFRSVGEAVAERLVSEVGAAIERQTSPRRQLAAGIDEFLQRVEASPQLYRFVLQLPPGSARGEGPLLVDYSTVVGLQVSRVIGEALRAAGRDTGLAEAWGFAIVGAARAAAERWLDHPVVTRAVLAEQLTALLWSGLRMPAQI